MNRIDAEAFKLPLEDGLSFEEWRQGAVAKLEAANATIEAMHQTLLQLAARHPEPAARPVARAKANLLRVKRLGTQKTLHENAVRVRQRRHRGAYAAARWYQDHPHGGRP